MGVGRGADHHRVDVVCGGAGINRADLAAESGAGGLGGLRVGFGDSRQLGAGHGGDGAGMDLADATGTQNCEAKGHSSHPA